MKRNGYFWTKITASVLSVALLALITVKYSGQVLVLYSKVGIMCAARYLPSVSFDLESDNASAETQAVEETQTQTAVETVQTQQNTAEAQTEKEPTKAVAASASEKDEDFYAVPDDINKMIKEAQKKASSDKKDGAIFEKQYTDDGVTDKYSLVKIKNVNKTKINVKELLEEKVDLSVNKKKPSVLVFHTHTTEAYQVLDRDFYAQGFITRSNDSATNMVRVGTALCEELEKAGFNVIHDTTIHDTTYSGSYERSRAAIEKYLKKYPTLQILLDVHRDAITLNNGTKIKPTVTINGKKAAQVMIISGCQEEGNGVTDFSDWRYNLVFAVALQNQMEKSFPGLTRPIYFSPRKYNMNMSHCSLLLEVGSDANTLEEARFTGKCIGSALALLMEEYTEK